MSGFQPPGTDPAMIDPNVPQKLRDFVPQGNGPAKNASLRTRDFGNCKNTLGGFLRTSNA
jgi:hypothetical protein